jgi:hypothetical protein
MRKAGGGGDVTRNMGDIVGDINARLQRGERNIGSAVDDAVKQARNSFTGGVRVRDITDGTSNTVVFAEKYARTMFGENFIPTDQFSVPRLGHGDLAGAKSLLTDHVTNIFQTKGFTLRGAQEWIKGELPTNAVDRTRLGAFGSRAAEEIGRLRGLWTFQK